MQILIIEDDANCRSTLSDLLEINGHTVVGAADGIEGLAQARQRPDLIFCDIAMPGKNGYEVITEIRREPDLRDIPFVFLTAQGNRADQRHGMGLGADDYITKPFVEKDIVEAISARVSRLREARERAKRLESDRRAAADAMWSHELMTPLCGILGGIELIEAGAENARPTALRDYLQLIRDGANRQYGLSRKLITYFSLERLRWDHTVARPRCGEAGAVATAAAQAAAQAAHRSGDLRVNCAPSGVISLSDTLIRAAVGELTENAFRFSAAGSKVEVSGRVHAQHYEIQIVDQGPGLPESQRVMAGPFRQFGRESREQQGLGLGLAIAQSAAAVAGGTLRLEDGPDGGLVATLELPTE